MRIKRKVSISCLGGRLGICLLLAFVPQLLFAQEDSAITAKITITAETSPDP